MARGFFLGRVVNLLIKRAVLFIDGFNLYHALDNTKNLHQYKWLNLWSLGEKFITTTEKLSDVFYFTAYPSWLPEKTERHKLYVAVNEHLGCNIVLGRFQKKERFSLHRCGKPCLPTKRDSNEKCGKKFTCHEEKLTDVNIAVNILKSCTNKTCDSIYLLSGDNDLIPALETAKDISPSARITVLIPPNAKSEKLKQVCSINGFQYKKIAEKHLKESLLPNQIVCDGITYNKPANWS